MCLLAMRILAWNIRHGGSAAQSLAPAIIAHDADVVVLSEYREKTNSLIDRLRFFGWPHSVASPVTGDTNGVAIIAKHPLVKRPSPFGEPPFPWWGVEATAGDISIIGLYAPLPDQVISISARVLESPSSNRRKPSG